MGRRDRRKILSQVPASHRHLRGSHSMVYTEARKEITRRLGRHLMCLDATGVGPEAKAV